MTTGVERATITTLRSNTVFTVPDRVAYDLGLFAKHGVDVEMSDQWSAPRNFAVDEQNDPLSWFTTGKFDTWNMCEWGSVYRVEKADERSGRIAYLRPAVVASAIVTFDPAIQEPHDLAGVPVSTIFTTGAHYTTLQILEGALRRDQIEIVPLPAGDPGNLIQQLKDGEFRATTVMEPWLSLAIREGAHVVGEKFYRGAQVFADSVPLEAQQAYVAAVNEAVDLINADPDAYREYVTSVLGGQLAPEEVDLRNYRFTYAKEISAERFDDTYRWMESWGLADGNKSFSDIVDASVLA